MLIEDYINQRVVEMVDIPKIQTNLNSFSTNQAPPTPTPSAAPAPVAVKIPSVAPTVRGVANREKKSLWVDNYPPEFHEYLKTTKRYPENLHTKSFAPNYNLWNQFVSQHEKPLSMIAAKKAMDEGEPEPEPEPEPEGTHEDRVREMMGY